MILDSTSSVIAVILSGNKVHRNQNTPTRWNKSDSLSKIGVVSHITRGKSKLSQPY